MRDNILYEFMVGVCVCARVHSCACGICKVSSMEHSRHLIVDVAACVSLWRFMSLEHVNVYVFVRVCIYQLDLVSKRAHHTAT